jgi:hypothetical protein
MVVPQVEPTNWCRRSSRGSAHRRPPAAISAGDGEALQERLPAGVAGRVLPRFPDVLLGYPVRRRSVLVQGRRASAQYGKYALSRMLAEFAQARHRMLPLSHRGEGAGIPGRRWQAPVSALTASSRAGAPATWSRRRRPPVQEGGRHGQAPEAGHRLGVLQRDVQDRQSGIEALTRDRADHPLPDASHREVVAEAGDIEGRRRPRRPPNRRGRDLDQHAASRDVPVRRRRACVGELVGVGDGGRWRWSARDERTERAGRTRRDAHASALIACSVRSTSTENDSERRS